MPMDFPDLKSLERAARVHNFRPKENSETVDKYRSALANWVTTRDLIESHEIRTGKGWDQWTDEENRDLLKRQGFKGYETPTP